MNGFLVVAWGLTFAAAMVLVVASVEHLQFPYRLGAVLNEHQVIHPRFWRVVAHSLGPVEATVGLGVLAAGFLGDDVWGWYRSGSLLIMSGLYVVLAVYAFFATAKAPGTACGCLGDQTPMTWWVPLRAVVFATATVFASMVNAPDSYSAKTLALVGAIVVTAAVWWLPRWPVRGMLSHGPGDDTSSGHELRSGSTKRSEQ